MSDRLRIATRCVLAGLAKRLNREDARPSLGRWSFALLVVAAFFLQSSPAAAFLFPSIYRIHEMANRMTGRYVLLQANERAAVEAGQSGPGWYFTGQTWKVYDHPNEFVNKKVPVCRFYSPASNSHFFTADDAECSLVARPESGWIRERIGFYAKRWNISGCLPSGTTSFPSPRPVFRLYDNRGLLSESSHRFTPDAAVRARLLAEGWTNEGVAFCVDDVVSEPVVSLSLSLGDMRSMSSCREEGQPPGICIWSRNLPAMSQWLDIAPYLPPNYIIANPVFPMVTAFQDRTGCRFAGGNVQVRTAQAGGDLGFIATRSFLQGPCGFHINTLDPLSGDLVGLSLRYQLDAREPSSGESDKRFFPWGDTIDRDVVISFRLGVRTVAYEYGSAQLYGLPVVTFQDKSSGKRIIFAVETYGTSPPQDLVIRDITSADLIVATVFRSDPAFGKRLSGDYIQLCRTMVECGANVDRDFKFSIARADFKALLEVVRGADPGLSSNPADYLIANFEFRNEISGGGVLGMSLNDYKLEVFAPR